MAHVKNFLQKVSTTSLRDRLKRLAGTGGPPWRTAVSLGLGVAIGLLPVVPFQGVLAVALAFALRLNRVAVLLGTLVWQPFTAPFILAAEFGVGRLFVRAPADARLSTWGDWLRPVLPGSLLVALAGGVLSGGVLYAVLLLRSRQKGASSVTHEGQV